VSEGLPLGLALAAGLGLGVFYFGGLWLTVKRLPTARHAAQLLLASAFVRMAVTLAGFYLVAGGEWQRLLMCLLGFFSVRVLMVRRLRPERADRT
jgi:F1F0 ATPase subunit 2